MSSQILNLPNGRGVIIDQHLDDAAEIETEGLIIGSNWGFNDLGGWYGQTFPALLGIPADMLRKLINNPLCILREFTRPRFQTYLNDRIYIIVVQSRRPDSTLKAAAFVPTNNLCAAYKKLVHGKPYCDFYYAVIFEAFELLADAGCSSISIAGIDGCGITHPDIQNCVAEALAHHALKNDGINKVVTISEGPDISYGINFFNENPEKLGTHREIQRELIVKDGISVLTIDLPHH